MAGQTDYPLLGAPTLSKAAFANVLRAAGSPAAGEASAIYDAFVRYGVNPAFALAISQHESGFGKAGIAVGRHNLFGNRYYASEAAFGASNKGGWASFRSYAANAAYEASLLSGGLYGRSAHYNTARTFPFRYAPSSDGNSPRNYGNAIVAHIAKWSGGHGAITSHPSKVATTHAHVKAHTRPVAHHPIAAYARAHPKSTGLGIGAAAALLIIL